MDGAGQESALCEATSGRWSVCAPGTWPWSLVARVHPGGMPFRSSSSVEVTVRPHDTDEQWTGVRVRARGGRMSWSPVGYRSFLGHPCVVERRHTGAYDQFLTSFVPAEGFRRRGRALFWAVRVASGPHPAVIRVTTEYRMHPNHRRDCLPPPPLGYEPGAHVWHLRVPVHAPKWVVSCTWAGFATEPDRRVSLWETDGW